MTVWVALGLGLWLLLVFRRFWIALAGVVLLHVLVYVFLTLYPGLDRALLTAAQEIADAMRSAGSQTAPLPNGGHHDRESP